MNATLRDTLRALPPEPPADLGQPSTARRRAHALRRRRYAAVSTGAVATVAAFALVASGALLPDSRTLRPATGDPLVGPFPGWPRRGDLTDRRVTDRAVEAWRFTTLQTRGISMVREPHVLYADGADDRPAVVLFHGTAERGGDRMVLATVEPNRSRILTDVPAPLPGVGAVTFAIPGALGGYEPCTVVDRASPTAMRLLVVGEPGARSARWRRTGTLPYACGDRGATGSDWEEVPLRDGAALVTLPFSDADVVVETRVSESFVVTGVPLDDATRPDSYGGVTTAGSATGAARVTDGSRAVALADAVIRTALPDGRRCETQWAQSLPDGTPIVLCVTAPRDGTSRGVVVAETGDRRVLAYDVRPGPGGDGFAAVVQGHDARWLVYAGPPTVTDAALVVPGERRPFPLTHGTGFLRVGDDEPLKGSVIDSSRYRPGALVVAVVEGREIAGRAGR